MKSQKDCGFSLRLMLATLRDAEQILDTSLALDERFILDHKAEMPSMIRHYSALGKAIERSLITGRKLVWEESVFPPCVDENLPRFLHSLTAPLFTMSGQPRYILKIDSFGKEFAITADHKNEGMLVAEKNAVYVFLLRQLLLMFSKSQDLECVVTPASELLSFKERITRDWNPRPGVSILLSTARYLLRCVLLESSDEGSRIHASLAQWVNQPFGRHGPGAVAGKEMGRQKWNFTVDAFRVSREIYDDSYGKTIGSIGFGGVYTSRACVVPKDFRGNRIICIEPKELQFAQQGLLQVIEDLLRSSPITRNHIALSKQERSFRMSSSLKYATIDLKDASDNISCSLAKVLLPRAIFDLVTRYRSTHILIDGESVRSKAFLTMGNALCFPFETLLFWALTAASILTQGGVVPPFQGDLDNIAKLPIRVYGDDIIVPNSALDWVVGGLSDVGLVINRDKTCRDTLVRESCGSWFYARKDCRIQRFKFCQTLDLSSWISFVPAIPQLRDYGLLQTAGVLETICDEIYPVPSVVKRQGYTERNSRYLRFNADLQRMEVLLPRRVQEDPRALPGSIGLTAWWTCTATRFSNTFASNSIEFEWEAL